MNIPTTVTTGPAAAPAPGAPALSDSISAPRLFIATLFDSRYLIAGSALVAVFVTLVYIALAAPIWTSEALVQVYEEDKTMAGLRDLPSALSETPADGEIELIRSRTLLGSVVDKLNLTIQAVPRTFPLVGAMMVRRYTGTGLAPPLFGFASYAWGGERIDVAQLDLPDNLLGRWLDLTVLESGGYRLTSPDRQTLVDGTVGKTAQWGDSSILIRQLTARPGTRFRLRQLRHDDVVDGLRSELRASERVRKTGLIAISMSGGDPFLTHEIVDAVARAYVLQNVRLKSAGAAATLDFIEQQLPTLKARVDNAEAALNSFQRHKQTVDLSAETQSMLDQSVANEKALFDLQLQRSDLAGRYAEGHPIMRAIHEKVEKLQGQQVSIVNKLRQVPEQELGAARLQRDVKVANELYFLLLNKAQELRVIKSGTVGNVRIIDGATRPRQPSSPKPILLLTLALPLGLAAGVGLAFVLRTIHGGIDDPDAIEAVAGIPIYAAIPHSTRQGDLARGSDGKWPVRVLAAVADDDPTIEAFRSLRTNIQFALLESDSKVMAISGPSPGIGKSFVSVNFAYVLAAFGQRVLLIDGDLRRGVLHRSLGLERGPGLSDVLAGEAALVNAVRKTSHPDLEVITAGTHRNNPSEMLGSVRFASLLETVMKSYDLVLIDTPPVLAVTDAALIGRCVGVNLLVLRAGDHNAREIKVTTTRLAQGGAPARGIVLNDAIMRLSRYGRLSQFGYHRYEYKSH